MLSLCTRTMPKRCRGEPQGDTSSSSSSNKKPYTVVFDLETIGLIQHAYGHTREEKIRNLDISCLSVLTIDSDAFLNDLDGTAIDSGTMKTYWGERTHMDADDTTRECGFGPVLELFDRAELIVGYNCISFDFQVLRKHYAPDAEARFQRHLAKTHDVFDRVRKSTGVWFKLDVLLGGYKKRAAALGKEIEAQHAAVAERRIELACFEALRGREALAGPQRAEELSELLSVQTSKEEELQARYAELTREQATLRELMQQRAPGA